MRGVMAARSHRAKRPRDERGANAIARPPQMMRFAGAATVVQPGLIECRGEVTLIASIR